MPTISRTHATLRFHGDDLEPDELTARLGAYPTLWGRKGEIMRESNPSRPKHIVARTGSWSVHAVPRVPGDIDGQIRELLELLTSDLDVWRDLSNRYKTDLYVGVFMTTFNEGIQIGPGYLQMLGERGVTIDLDLYGSENDPDGVLKGTIAVIEEFHRPSKET